jgi:pimeloyl-ACP methyl ester carboxylesterase
LEFVLNKLKIRGKIGVYGRSIGGIASTHLAAKFPNIVESLIVDRTLNELDDLAQRRLYGRCTKAVFRFVSGQWRALND